MGIFEIISAIALILACVVIVIVVLMQNGNTGMSQAISGTSADSFYQKNSGRTKEAKLNRACTVAAVIFFVLALAVNIINVHFGKAAEDEGSDIPTSSVVDTVVTDEADITVTVEASTAEAAE
ncbi:MAG: preprotein translocase subunit SecG [Oscillospiraceae bacterium]|nr:preprotein translocase subunit SecG [Oscillospiraceae bacterium]